MAGAGRPVDFAARELARVLDALGADAGFVASLAADGANVEVARVTRYCDNPVPLDVPLDAPYPLAAAIRLRQAFWIADNEALLCEHPTLVRMREADHACATVPLVRDDGRIVGALNVTFEDPHEFDAEERELIERAAAACAAMLTAPMRAAR